ncbi:MAG: aminotransferase class V-fold PLP-dependent enzyme [Eubacterium sp.]|nr:aminotransferase class V-fold PLP-dependent enzyme [Eubacterium sp.]
MSTETEYMNTSAAEENRKEIRNCFPILQTTVHERPLVYLDNAATMQMPLPEIERMTAFYTRKNANIHRGIHMLSEMATEAYEKARETAGTFLGVKDTKQIIFTSGTTDGINMAADMLERILEPGDEIMITEMEHHSNFLPWAELAERKGVVLRIVPVMPDGCLDPESRCGDHTECTRIVRPRIRSAGRDGCLSFVAEGVHAYDLCRFLDQYGIAARSGHHCAMPYLMSLGCEYAVRFSVAPYNTEEEIRYAADACRKICELIRKTSGSCRRQ